MFTGRYGFFPDSEVPFGRLQPYVGVGPAIMFTSMKPKLHTRGIGTFNGVQTLGMDPGNQGSTDIALAVDAGVRYMALKNVSFDLSFKYRYAQPNYTFNGQNGPDFVPAKFTMSPALNLYSFQLGVAYHF
jgi:opacity protein-like surface antigen